MLNFHCSAVEQKDKAFAQGLSLMLVSLLALIPGPIIYGIVIDNACTVWNNVCGIRGNCQLYDQTKFRYYVNSLSLVLTVCGIVLDIFVWQYSKDLQLYDENEGKAVSATTPNDRTERTSKLNQQQIRPLLKTNKN